MLIADWLASLVPGSGNARSVPEFAATQRESFRVIVTCSPPLAPFRFLYSESHQGDAMSSLSSFFSSFLPVAHADAPPKEEEEQKEDAAPEESEETAEAEEEEEEPEDVRYPLLQAIMVPR